jgi:hypothetical protein
MEENVKKCLDSLQGSINRKFSEMKWVYDRIELLSGLQNLFVDNRALKKVSLTVRRGERWTFSPVFKYENVEITIKDDDETEKLSYHTWKDVFEMLMCGDWLWSQIFDSLLAGEYDIEFGFNSNAKIDEAERIGARVIECIKNRELRIEKRRAVLDSIIQSMQIGNCWDVYMSVPGGEGEINLNGDIHLAINLRQECLQFQFGNLSVPQKVALADFREALSNDFSDASTIVDKLLTGNYIIEEIVI